MPRIPRMRRVVLVPFRGEENMALSLTFERPLKPREQGLFLGELAAFALEGCEVYEPRFRDSAVHLHPAKGQGQLEESDYIDLLDHFGAKIEGPIPITDEQYNHDADNIVHVAQETSYVH